MKLPELVSAKELMALSVGEQEFLVDRMVPTEGIVLLYGKFSTFKTPIALTIATAVSRGTPALWGLAVKQANPVLVLNVDSPNIVYVRRAQSLKLDPELDMDFALGYPGMNVVDPDITPVSKNLYYRLREAHLRREYKLVIVDALRGIHSLPDKDSETVLRVYGGLAELFPGAVVLIIHHERKRRQDEDETTGDETFAGSQAWANHATTSLKVTRTVMKSGTKMDQVTVTQQKSQAGALADPVRLAINGGVEVVQANSVEFELIERAIKDLGPGASMREVDQAIARVLGVSERTARQRRSELLGSLPAAKAALLLPPK